MVMVNKGSVGSNSVAQTDPELARLERIPSFLPIMRATLSGAAGAANKAGVLQHLQGFAKKLVCGCENCLPGLAPGSCLAKLTSVTF